MGNSRSFMPNWIHVSVVCMLIFAIASTCLGHSGVDSDSSGKTNYDIARESMINVGDTPNCTYPQEYDRFDCHPGSKASEDMCQQRGCCWHPPSTPQGNGSVGVPSCFFPTDYPTYQIDQLIETDFGYTAMMSFPTRKPYFPGRIYNLQIDVYFETETRLHFKIYDAICKRFEVPYVNQPVVKTKVENTDYVVQFSHYPFGLTVLRKSTKNVLFDTTIKGAPLIFADQFLQISSRIGASAVYGLGEHRGPFRHNMTWTQFSFWSRVVSPSPDNNLYGVHPFFLAVDNHADSYGVFLLNSNAMEVVLQPTPAITYRTIGGILDFYIFTGPSPDAVVQQYTDVVGKPYLPPYWSLGFHLSRFGYESSNATAEVIQNNRKTYLPYDTQWNDIDYMRQYLDFTYDEKAYAGLPGIVQDLHGNGQHYVVVLDSGISRNQTKGSYPPYDNGIAKDIFIKRYYAKDQIVGQGWPGPVVYPDFTNPLSHDYWYQLINDFQKVIPFDGLWIDMNEPANFVDGSVDGCIIQDTRNQPYYTPRVLGGFLYSQTICPSAVHNISSHFNLHNLYGFTETIATQSALQKIRQKRSLLVSRSTFPGSGHYAGHVTGDNFATWDDMKFSISAILNFQLFGIPQTGADICGNRGYTTAELCIRWMQLGSFYPLMRNHNYRNLKPQDPASFNLTVQNDMRSAMELRYFMLPYLYTLFFNSHLYGSSVIRPLFFQFPSDVTAQTIDTQFLVGDALLVSPVLQQGAQLVKAYFPKGKWYPLNNSDVIETLGEWKVLEAPISFIPVHIHGGSIIPGQFINTTTTASRRNPFCLVVALSSNATAEGELIWDDGESLNVSMNLQYSHITFKANQTASMGILTSSVIKSGYKPSGGMWLSWIAIYGVPAKPQKVIINGGVLPLESIEYDTSKQMLQLTIGKLDLLTPFSLSWL